MKRHVVWILAGLMLIAMLGFASISLAEKEKWKSTKIKNKGMLKQNSK
jgi:hypothetical protein